MPKKFVAPSSHSLPRSLKSIDGVVLRSTTNIKSFALFALLQQTYVGFDEVDVTNTIHFMELRGFNPSLTDEELKAVIVGKSKDVILDDGMSPLLLDLLAHIAAHFCWKIVIKKAPKNKNTLGQGSIEYQNYGQVNIR